MVYWIRFISEKPLIYLCNESICSFYYVTLMKQIIWICLIHLYHGWSWITNHCKRLAFNLFVTHAHAFILILYFWMQDFKNFVTYVCKAYKGHLRIKACKSLPEETNVDENAIQSMHGSKQLHGCNIWRWNLPPNPDMVLHHLRLSIMAGLQSATLIIIPCQLVYGV